MQVWSTAAVEQARVRMNEVDSREVHAVLEDFFVYRIFSVTRWLYVE